VNIVCVNEDGKLLWRVRLSELVQSPQYSLIEASNKQSHGSK